MAKKTVANQTQTAQKSEPKVVVFPKATINIQVTLGGTSGVTDEQIAAALGLGPNQDPAVSSASVEAAIKKALSGAAGSGTLKLRRASTGNLIASVPLNGAAVEVTAKRESPRRSDDEKAADAAAFFGLGLD